MRDNNALALTVDLEPVRERLREWGHFYRDRRRTARAASAEGNYISPQRNHHEPIPGDSEPHPTERGFSRRRADDTNAMVRDTFCPYEGANVSFRALSFWYCMKVRPGMMGTPIWPILRNLSRAAKYKVDQGGYVELVILAECKLAPKVYKTSDLAYIAGYDPRRPIAAERSPRIGRAAFPLENARWNPSHTSTARPMQADSVPLGVRLLGPSQKG